MARLLDPSRSFGMHRGDSHLHVYEQGEQDHFKAKVHYFDHKGRECDPKTGVALDPKEEGLSDAQIFNKPLPAATTQDVGELTKTIAELAAQVAALQAAQGVVPETPVAPGDMKVAELKELLDAHAVSYHPSAKREELVQLAQELAA